MLIELKKGTSSQEREWLVNRLKRMGFQVDCAISGKLAVLRGMTAEVQYKEFERLPHVHRVSMPTTRYILASRQYKAEETVIRIKDVTIGGGSLFIVGGPCSIESQEQIRACAKAVKGVGAQGLRGGAFKPRTSPYEFQGLKEQGLRLLQRAGDEYGLITISEVMEIAQIPLLVEYVDVLQVGARNMQNFNLLKELGKLKTPILLKRGFSATYQDLLMAAEYILSEGNSNVMLCERGIRTFEGHTRNTLDLNAVPVLRELTHLPIIVDPSHGTGLRSLVAPMSKASLAAGADGLLLEIHPDPDRAVSDAQQTISLEAFTKLTGELNMLHATMKQFL